MMSLVMMFFPGDTENLSFRGVEHQGRDEETNILLKWGFFLYHKDVHI